MGQYYYTVNITKKQYLNPHRFGEGLKLLEFCSGRYGTLAGLAILLTDGNGRGGGDLHRPGPDQNLPKLGALMLEVVGSWAGDRIVVAGDYGDEGRFTRHKKASLYQVAKASYEDISYKVMACLCADQWVREDIAKDMAGRFAFIDERPTDIDFIDDLIPGFKKQVKKAKAAQDKKDKAINS